MKLISKISTLALLAMAMLTVSCGTDNGDDNGKTNLSALQIYFGADSYSAEAGETITIPFTISGVEGKTLTLTASSDTEGCEFKVTNDASYQGNIKVTLPTVVTSAKTVSVSLKAVDEANKRETTSSVPVAVSASEKLAVSILGDMNSIASKGGVSTTIKFNVTGVSSDAITLSTPKVTVSSGWTSSVSMESKSVGVIALSSSATSGSVTVDVEVSDNFNRKATTSRTYNIIAVTETTGAANSYIVATGSKKTIAAVKGNSTDKVEFDYVTLVWQDERGLVKSVAGSSNDNVVVVEFNSGITGNAVVAAMSGDKAVWSWHFWVSDFDPNTKPIEWTNATSGKTYYMMDRNLGAKTDVGGDARCFGLLYQWGRKDPFVSGSGLESDIPIPMYDINNNVIKKGVIAIDAKDQKDGDTNLELSIQNPNSFIYYSYAPSSVQFSDWYTFDAAAQNNDLWGYETKYKNRYDPCPDGWRVAPSEAFTFRGQYKKAGNLNDSGAYDSTYPWYWDEVTDAAFFYNDPISKNIYFFPMAGRLNNDTGANEGVGGGGSFWTPEPSQKFAMVAMTAFGNPNSATGLRRDYGYAVRCVKDYNY